MNNKTENNKYNDTTSNEKGLTQLILDYMSQHLDDEGIEDDVRGAYEILTAMLDK